MYNFQSMMYTPGVAPIIFLTAILDICLKGIAMYKSAKREQTIWFVALLLINSAGILPIIYFLINKDVSFISIGKNTQKKTVKKSSKKSK